MEATMKKAPVPMTAFLTLLLLISLSCVSQASPSTLPTVDVAQVIAQTAAAANASTQTAAAILLPTNTTIPIAIPSDIPTNPPLPTITLIPEPNPVTFTGSGDSIVDFDNHFEIAIVHITGNATSRFFAVINYDGSGNKIDLLVNTTDPYDGIRPLDFGDNRTVRFEVQAIGDWKIEVLPFSMAHTLNVPGVITGNGDDVILLAGGTPDLATVTGNEESRFFAVLGYGHGKDVLVNTTEPYQGTVILSPDTLVLEIQANGKWSIDVTAK